MRVFPAILLCLVIDLLQVYEVESWLWSRRRRRRKPPPSPVDCTYTSWSSWSSCNRYCGVAGSQSRTRTVDTQASWGGSCNKDTSQSQSCSRSNPCSGPSSQCNPGNGACSCSNAGYQLDGSRCKDRNECSSNNGKGPCDQICTNTAGSYTCSCNNGYSLSGKHACVPKDCGSLTTSSCPSNSYVDSFSHVCKKVSVSCPSGTTFQQSCLLSCSSNYKVGKIMAQNGERFGQNYAKIDFSSVKTTATCSLHQGGSAVAWDISQDVSSYYCRRANDPPTDITLSANQLPEHSPSGHTIGKLVSVDAQPGQSFIYSVQKHSILFNCQGDLLKSTWNNPDLHGAIGLDNGMINVTIRSVDNGNPNMWMDKIFTIQITDVNDPPINITLSNNNVYENASIGSIIGNLKARDKDDLPGTPASSDFTWALTNDGNGIFAVNGSHIVVKQKLDHESQKLHQITVSCTDRGTPPQTSKQDFVINVLNTNELPVSLTLSSTSVNENSAIGTTVGKLMATDEDNDPIQFSISKSSKETLSKFNLTSTTCTSIGRAETCQSSLKVKGDLDYEERSSYQLIVLASDTSGQIVKEWKVNVINVNERPTSINLTGSHDIHENSPKGTDVGYFMVTDPDNKNTITQTHNCVLESGDVDYFTVDSKTVLKVSGTRTLDYETKSKLNITVRCTDDGKNPPSLSTTQKFVINVIDVNEPPTNLSLSKLTVTENAPLDTVVGKLSCDDPEKSYQNYTYSIQGPKGTPFMLGGQDNDMVLVNGSIDYEKTKQLNLIIKVLDSGHLFQEKTFKIAVENVNEPPTGIILPGQNGKLTIQEDALGFFISLIKLDDQDTNDKDPTDCQLFDNAENRVQIVKSPNWILKSGPVKTDSETSHGYLTTTLNCSDSHDIYIEKSFNITITDINEKPTDIHLANNTVPENQADSFIGIVTVTDPDIHQSYNCTVCEVTNGGCIISQYFEVNSAMELKTKKALDFEAKNVYNIEIKCRDLPSPPQGSLSVEKPFTVFVTDVNEAPSSLCSSPILVSIHKSNGAIITPLNAVDPDNEGANKQVLTYSMDNDLNNGIFQLKENHIFKSKEISSVENFTLAITVTDNGRVVSRHSPGGYRNTKQLSSVFNCTVIVTDSQPLNDIRLSSNVVSIMATKGTVVGTLNTTGGSPGEVYVYRLLDNELKPFTVDGNKLKVLLTAVPHHSITSENPKELLLDIMIESTDSKNNVVTKKMIILIENDAPSISMCLVKQSINENQPTNTTVGQIMIEDPQPAKYQCSKSSCCSQINTIPAGSFDYRCQANNPDDNAIILPKNNITTLFYVDDRYLLRSKVRFNYQDYVKSEGGLKVTITCHDLLRPLHIIGKTVTVNIKDCDADGNCPHPPECGYCNNGGSCQDGPGGSYTCACPAGFTGNHCQVDINHCASNPCQYGSTCHDLTTTFKCKCMPGYSGLLCNRKEDLCSECQPDTLCVEFVQAAERCLSSGNQVPILVSGQSLTPQELLVIENEISTLAEENIDKESNKTPVSSRKKRSSQPRFYTETLKNETVSDDKTLLYLAILDGNNNYQPLTAISSCSLLKDTNRQCVDTKDCETIKESGKQCPDIGLASANKSTRNSTGLSGGGAAGIGLLVVFVIVVLLIGGIFYYRKKAQKAKAYSDRNAVYNSNQDNVDFDNPVYAEGNTNNGIDLQDLAKDRLGKEELVNHNLDRSSIEKRNDIRVTENALYEPPSGHDAITAENPSYISAGAMGPLPKKNNMEEEKPKNIDLKTGKTFSVSLDDNGYENPDDLKGAKGHAMNGHAMKGNAMKGNAMKGHAMKGDNEEKPRVNISQHERRPRYEENPVKRFPTRHEYENPNDLGGAVGNPLYDVKPVGLPGDPGKHVYDNVIKKTNNINDNKDFMVSGSMDTDDIGENSIINPLYDLADPPTGDLDQEPLYEEVPPVTLNPASGKTKSKGFRRSLSSEKAAGYAEIDDDQDHYDLDDDDDTFGNSDA